MLRAPCTVINIRAASVATKAPWPGDVLKLWLAAYYTPVECRPMMSSWQMTSSLWTLQSLRRPSPSKANSVPCQHLYQSSGSAPTLMAIDMQSWYVTRQIAGWIACTASPYLLPNSNAYRHANQVVLAGCRLETADAGPCYPGHSRLLLEPCHRWDKPSCSNRAAVTKGQSESYSALSSGPGWRMHSRF